MPDSLALILHICNRPGTNSNTHLVTYIAIVLLL